MPRLILIIPDNDILLSNLNVVDQYDYGACHICNEITKWLVDNIERGHQRQKRTDEKAQARLGYDETTKGCLREDGL